MKHDEKKGGTKSNSSLFFSTEFKVFFVILIFSISAFVNTFYFATVPPILNRGIQPATFPKILLILIICLTSLIYYLSFKNPWKKKEKLPKEEIGTHSKTSPRKSKNVLRKLSGQS